VCEFQTKPCKHTLLALSGARAVCPRHRRLLSYTGKLPGFGRIFNHKVEEVEKVEEEGKKKKNHNEPPVRLHGQNGLL
jgi:hypothetical protein